MAETPIVLDGRWELTSDILGTGAYGKVYKGIDLETKEYVAIKFFSSRYKSIDNENTASIEVNVLKLITFMNVPDIVKLLDGPINTDAGWYAVYNFIDGSELIDYLQTMMRTNLNLRQSQDVSRGLLSMMIQLCETIADLSNICIVHRDLKPENVMKLKGQYKVVVVDLGLACARRNCEFKMPDGRQARPSGIPKCSDNLLGTPGYKPPEYVRESLPYSERRIDVYALGRVLYEMGSGRFHYNKQELNDWTYYSWDEVAYKVTHDSTGILELDDLVIKMLNPDAAMRLTMEEIVNEIRKIDLKDRVFNITKIGMSQESNSEPEPENKLFSEPQEVSLSKNATSLSKVSSPELGEAPPWQSDPFQHLSESDDEKQFIVK